MDNKKHNSKRKKRAVRIVIVIAAILLIGTAGILIYAKSVINKINFVETDNLVVVDPAHETFGEDDEEPTDEPDTVAPEDITFELPESVEKTGSVINMLLIGVDAREDVKGRRSDSMVICSINENTNKITLVSLLRDMYVPIPGYSDNRLNAAYSFGGMKLLDETIENALGIQIDGNVEVDFNGFIKAMDKIGNLEIDLKDYEIKDMQVINGDWTDLKPGPTVLTSEQLLAYARIRDSGNGDYERSDRQREVLYMIFNKLVSSDVTTLLKSANDILPCITTDMEVKDLLDVVYRVKTNDMSTGESFRIPAEDTFKNERIRRMAVLVPDLQANRDFLETVLYGDGGQTGSAPEAENS